MRIGVLMGGRSPEREISIKTGTNIVNALNKAGHDAVGIDAQKDVVDRIRQEKIDLAFIALHGPYGEDGTIQGLLEFLDIPYVGSGVMASSVAMNKVMTRKFFKSIGVKIPPGYNFFAELLDTREGICRITSKAKDAGVSLPVIVKPSVGGSTIGMTIVREENQLMDAWRLAAEYCREILVERYLPGTEITVGVLGDIEPFALPVIEIIAQGGWYNYTTKYQPGMSTHIIPARIPDKFYRKAQEESVRIFSELYCLGMARVDFIVSGDDLWCLEINTIPGMTETSLLPEAAANAGINFEKLLTDQVEYALARHQRDRKAVGV